MPSAEVAPPRSRIDATLAAITTTLLVLAIGGGVWGVVAPGSGSARPPSSAAPTAFPSSAPTRLEVRSLGIDAEIVPIALTPEAVLDPPEDASTVGWWDGSAQPGATSGRVVVTGHTLEEGGGALDRMVDLRRGRVVLTTPTGIRRYEVTDRFVVDYATVAERARDIFGQTEDTPGGAPLVLVTCTDFNGSFYESNVIVVARPV